MRIGIGASLHDGGLSGIGRYVGALLEGLAAHRDGTEYVVFRPGAEVGALPEGPHLRYVRLPRYAASPLAGIFWHHAFLRGHARRLRLDAFHFLTSRRLTLGMPCPTVVTVHDLAPLHVRDKFDPARMLYHNRVIPRLLRGHDLFVAVSEATAGDLRSLGFNRERIHVIPQGVDHARYYPRPRPDASAFARQRFGLPGPFLLYVARLEHPGKNHVRLLRAFRDVGAADPALQLVLAGAEWFGQEAIYAETRRLRLDERVRFLGFVGDADLPWLYSAAEALVFPSLFEGFGLPVLEAMACGTPVVASNVSSLPEVVGECGILVDPQSEVDIARGIRQALASARNGRRQVEEGIRRAREFTWEKTVAQTRHVHRLAVADGARRPH